MATINDAELLKQVKSAELSPLYFFYGSEVYTMNHITNLIIKKSVGDSFTEFNLQQFDGESIELNDVFTAYEALPLMAQYKCVEVKNLNIDKLNKNDFDKLVSLLQNPNMSTVLILKFTNNSLDIKKSKVKKVCDIITKNGTVCEFAPKSKTALKKLISDRCIRENVKISPVNCELIIDRCGSDIAVLFNETDKLISYMGNGNEITKEAIKLLCTESIQSSAFDLARAILQHNYDLAFNILTRLFSLRQEPLMILGALSSSFIDLYRIKSALNAGVGLKDIVKDFSYRSEYGLNRAYREAERFSTEQIRHCISSLLKADSLLKSSKLDDRLVLEKMLGEMMANSVYEKMI